MMLGDGAQSKSYVHVSDVISAMLFVGERAQKRVNLFNAEYRSAEALRLSVRGLIEKLKDEDRQQCGASS